MSGEQALGDEFETPADADAERARLVAKVEHSLAQLRAGRGVSHAEVVAMIDQRYPAAPDEGSAFADGEAERAAFVAAVEAGTLRYMHAVDGAKDDAIDALERFDAHEFGHSPRAPILIRTRSPS